MRYKVPIWVRLLDAYLKRPIIIDIFASAFMIIAQYFIKYQYQLLEFDSKQIGSLNSDLISTSISLAGFVLASLTIIVTFKDSVAVRVYQLNPRDLFFNSKHYYPTVKLFYSASIILLLIFLTLSITKLIYDEQYKLIFDSIIICGLIMVTTTTLRSLYLLFQIIKLQTKNE